MTENSDNLYSSDLEEPQTRSLESLAKPFSDEVIKTLYFRYHSQRSKARRAALRFPWLSFDEFLQDLHFRTKGAFDPYTQRLKFGKPVNGGYLKDRLTIERAGNRSRRLTAVDNRLPTGLREQRSEYMELLSDVQKLDGLCEKAARIVTALNSEGTVDLDQLVRGGTDLA